VRDEAQPIATDRQSAGPIVGGPKVLEKALRVLDLFTVERPSWSLTEIAREL
jgi:hypothetical protein